MPALTLPCMIFKTQKWMDDYYASDMRCGDLSEKQLKSNFHMLDVSTKVDPYTLTKITAFSQPQSMFYGYPRVNEKLTRQQCAAILFDEFRQLSRTFAIYSPYKPLIEQMITHMQKNNGTPFRHMLLDIALREQIISDNTGDSTRILLQKALNSAIDWQNKSLPKNKKDELKQAILDGRLPKFDRFKDNFNGMGITIHDTAATHIIIKSLEIDNDRYHAIVHYKVQDHFGLDNNDILNSRFSHFRFFRIWFVLQRYVNFAFRPFMTTMEATIEINGVRDDNKK
ncbi:YPO3983 family protein [Pseudescherichia sp.]|uniref:YPO3983 family protein n=1 Tax=Pseudescherichia sp. TaxID=2055881 RepID=UPI0028AF8DCF|nr:YPO3983 family protein [Pseudescherichia sp.]